MKPPDDDDDALPADIHTSEAAVRAMDRFLVSLPPVVAEAPEVEDRLPVLSSRKEQRDDGFWWIVYLADGQSYMMHKLDAHGLHVNPLTISAEAS